MTVEQYEKARQLGDEIVHLKHLITLLTATKLESKIIIEATYKIDNLYNKDYHGGWIQKPIREIISYDDIKDAFVKILEEKRDRLTKEFESL